MFITSDMVFGAFILVICFVALYIVLVSCHEYRKDRKNKDNS